MLSYLGIFLSFVIIFILVLYKVNLGLSFVAGAILLGIFFMSPPLFFDTIVQTINSLQTIELVLNLLAISTLNFVYANSGSSEDLINTLRKMVSSSILMILMPIIFGILPVSGGALFSAPLVDLEGQKMALKTERKIFFNMWFRHIPHLIYPLETALVIAATLSHIALGDLLLYQLPIFLIGLLIGLPLALRGIDGPHNIHVRRVYLKDFTRAFWPVLTVVLLIAIFQVKVYIATTFGTIIILLTRRVTVTTISSRIKDLASIACLAIGLMLYRNFFEQSGAIVFLSTLIQSQAIWPPLWQVGFAFLIGFILGESTPSTTLAMAVLGHVTFNPATAGLVFSSVYLGHLISPLHLCFAVTADYFKAHLLEMYHRLFPATIITLIANAGIMLFLDIYII
jgi:integral membrane protein (TIGR00529 family)